MSTTTLDPLVTGKLRQFSRRRFWMILLRGICAVVVTFLLCMAVVAFLDWGWVLSENMRWGLSAAAYCLTAAVTWIVSGRSLIHKPAQEEVASQVETAEPELREQLLSAVELATDSPGSVHDSPVFRGLLQGRVAKQMEKIRVGKILPVRLMMKWLFAAGAVTGAIAFVLTTGGPRFRNLAARAVMPMANIDRVSRIKVEILEPTPNSTMIAKDDTIAIVVSTSGGAVEEAILETRVPGKAPVQQTMRARTDSEFAANIHIEDEEVQYRILAGDAITKRHTIKGKNRPRALAFHKSFQFPDYSGIGVQTLTEDHGDVVVLQGTQAKLAVELNQNVVEAELRLNGPNSDEVTAIPLVENAEGHWEAVVPVTDGAIYKVHLVSAETGFENLFSPRYEIRPLPDLIPRAGFVDQSETNLLLPPNDILALRGMAEDDLPLHTLQQEFSVNGRNWIAVPLEVTQLESDPSDTDSISKTAASDPTFKTNRITSSWDWDLLDLELKTGDQITTRLVATDLKGNRGESVPLRIVVSSPEFDPDRHAVMERRADVIRSLDQLSKVAQEHKASAIEIIKRLQAEVKTKQQRTEAEIALDCTTLKELAIQTQELTQRKLQEVLKVTQSMPAGTYAYELDLAGRVLARIASDHTNRVAHSVQVFTADTDSKARKQSVNRLKEGFDRSADDSKSLAYHYRHLVTQDIFSALAWDFDAMLQQQELIVNSPTQTFSRLRRQQTVVLNQLQIVEGLAKNQRPNVPEFLTNHLDQLVDWTDRWIEKLDRSMESEDHLAVLQQDVGNLYRELEDRQRYDVIDGGMATRLHQARRDLDYRSGSLVEPLSLMSTATHEETKRLVLAAKANDSATVDKYTMEAAAYAAEVDIKIRPALEQLRLRRELSQGRIDSDTQFAADAGMTHRAVNSLLNQHRSNDPSDSIVPTAFREIAPAYRTLEAGHDMANAMTMLNVLLQAERWQSQETIARTAHPAQWDAVSKGLEEAVNRMRQAGISNDVVSPFDQVRWSVPAQQAGRKIAERRWKRDLKVSAARDMADLKEGLQSASTDLQPVMAEARAVIAKYSPTIPEMAKQLAKNVRKLEDKTTDTADSIEQQQPQSPKPSANKQELAELETQQERINQQIDDLFEALVEDANQQDLTKDAEKERARDADDSIAMIQQPAKQMNWAMQEAQQANEAEQQAQNLSEAAEQQEKTAQAIEQIAQHFEKLDSGEDIADSRAELRQAEKDLGLARQMDQKFEPPDQLAQMTASTEESLMDLLENELKNNPAMQEALSEIAQNTVEEAKNAVEDAANTDNEIQKANERSDAEFQGKKKQVANDLRELGKEASELANRLVAQADSAASQAKTPEAKQKFQETRQQLAEAANTASRSNDGQLLAELAENAKAIQEAMKDATTKLAEAKEQSAEAKDKEVHADDKSRNDAKRNLENQQKRFADQLKRDADQEVKRRDSEERREAANVRNAQNNVKQMDSKIRQAQKKLDRKPDDRNLKNQVAQAESRKQQAQKKVEQAQQKQQQAQQRENQAREERNKLNSFPQPSLDDKNPAAQLAESLAAEAEQRAKTLQGRADKIARQLGFENELSPKKDQLARATQQQKDLSEDVTETSEDIARAARHERRLENEAASQTLQEAAENVQSVAKNESANAEQQLAAAEASAAESNDDASREQTASEAAIAANEALAISEAAFSGQAGRLGEIVEAAEASQQPDESQQQPPETANAQEAGQAREPQSQQSGPQNSTIAPQPGQTSPAQTEEGVASSGQPGAVQPDSGSPPQGRKKPQAFTPDEKALGQQLAKALDELDQLQSTQSQLAQSASEGQQGEPASPQSTPQTLQSLSRAAQKQAAQLAQQRAQALQQTKLSQESKGFTPKGMPQLEGATDEFAVADVDRSETEDWGKLRDKEAEDLTRGRREAVSAEYRKSVEAYFKVLAERARRRK